MFCKNCGAPVQDSAAFCPSCGTKIAVEQVTPPVQEQPAYTPTQPTYAPEQAQYQQPVYNAPQDPYYGNGYAPYEPPKKKKTGKIIAISLLVLAVILTAAIIIVSIDGTAVFKNNDITFEYPDSWDLEEKGDETILSSPRDDINVNILYVEGSVKAYEDVSISEFKRTMEASTLYDISDVRKNRKTNDNDVEMIVFKYDVEGFGEEAEVTQLIFEANDRCYVITYTALEDKTDSSITNIINTLDIVD